MTSRVPAKRGGRDSNTGGDRARVGGGAPSKLESLESLRRSRWAWGDRVLSLWVTVGTWTQDGAPYLTERADCVAFGVPASQKDGARWTPRFSSL